MCGSRLCQPRAIGCRSRVEMRSTRGWRSSSRRSKGEGVGESVERTHLGFVTGSWKGTFQREVGRVVSELVGGSMGQGGKGLRRRKRPDISLAADWLSAFQPVYLRSVR